MLLTQQKYNNNIIITKKKKINWECLKSLENISFSAARTDEPTNDGRPRFGDLQATRWLLTLF